MLQESNKCLNHQTLAGRVCNVKMWADGLSYLSLQPSALLSTPSSDAWHGRASGTALRRGFHCAFWKLPPGYKSQAQNKAQAYHPWVVRFVKTTENTFIEVKNISPNEVYKIFFHFQSCYLTKLTLSNCAPEGSFFF